MRMRVKESVEKRRVDRVEKRRAEQSRVCEKAGHAMGAPGWE